MARRLCDVTDARRLLNPGPVAIVTTSWRAITNAAPVAWTAPLSMAPPLVGVVIHPHRHTSDMIRFSEEFAINIPGPDLAREVAFLGSVSGVQMQDKIAAAGLDTFPAMSIDAPLIAGCLAWIECGVHDVIPVGDHTLFVGRPVRVQALDEAYAQRWLLESPRYSPLTYLGGPHYAVIGQPREVQFRVNELGALETETAEERERREEEEAREAERLRAEGADERAADSL